ncbi:uncharacterized protein LOC129959378 [Argiope bruennichi]|uniref:uncharacterized protein LOC129959378 n=1 Tax=Argiope bruennichi TaxID=94029 RepID=UPI0024954A01|nr:uncharacterized protein LOC129959378 [Argiope bruennichi]
MTNLGEEFWILKYRKTVRKVVKNYVSCKSYDARAIETPTAPLPVADLERPLPAVVYSDNGTNLVGANNLIKKINWKIKTKYNTVNKIDWKFIPPSAPWWGGFWERLIGIVKRILLKVLGQTSPNFEELSTVLCDCESVINGRPLTYVSDDSNDLEPLTPNMFLQEVREVRIPALDLLDSNSLNKRFAYRQRLRQDLRKRFRSEYLEQLRQFERKETRHPSRS